MIKEVFTKVSEFMNFTRIDSKRHIFKHIMVLTTKKHNNNFPTIGLKIKRKFRLQQVWNPMALQKLIFDFLINFIFKMDWGL